MARIREMWADSEPARGRSARRVPVLLAGGAALTVAAVIAAVVIVRSGDDPPAGPSAAGPPASATSPPVAATGTPTAVAAVVTDGDAGARAVEAALAGAVPRTIRYTFDAGPGRAMLDSAGRYALRPVVAGRGAIAFDRRGDGYSVRFPARCRLAAERCPRAILESTSATLFNSGTRPVRFGAAVLMTRADTGPGANVLQKGFSVGGGTQFKLQVDGRAGRPSCVLASGRTIYRLTGPLGIADGRWHSVVCTRAGGRLSINVDGQAISRRVPAALSIRNSEPLRIGGKSAGPYNDQFAGRLDNVFVTLY